MTMEDTFRLRGFVETSPGVWAKGHGQFSPPPLEGTHVTHEADLHEKIEEELKRRRWWYCHSRMDKATTTQLGVPDFIIAAPSGLTYWIEVKKHGGKLTPEQNITMHVLKALGHRHCVVFSFEGFLQAIGPI